MFGHMFVPCYFHDIRHDLLPRQLVPFDYQLFSLSYRIFLNLSFFFVYPKEKKICPFFYDHHDCCSTSLLHNVFYIQQRLLVFQLSSTNTLHKGTVSALSFDFAYHLLCFSQHFPLLFVCWNVLLRIFYHKSHFDACTYKHHG